MKQAVGGPVVVRVPMVRTAIALLLIVNGVHGCDRVGRQRPEQTSASMATLLLADKIIAYRVKTGHDPTIADWTPSTSPCAQGRLASFPVNLDLWRGAPWSDLGFSIDKESRTALRIERDGTSIVARARYFDSCDGPLEVARRISWIGDKATVTLLP